MAMIPCSGGDEFTDDYILFQPGQFIPLAFNSGLSQYIDGVLEGGSGQEAVGI